VWEKRGGGGLWGGGGGGITVVNAREEEEREFTKHCVGSGNGALERLCQAESPKTFCGSEEDTTREGAPQ